MIFSRFVFSLVICMTVAFGTYAFAQDLPNNFHEHRGLMKGAVPGFSKGKKKFDSTAAKAQILSLYKNKGVRIIVSLDHCEDVRGVLETIKFEYKDFSLDHECRKIRRGENYYTRNAKLFRFISSTIGHVPTFVHCRYGAHRAVTAITGAWIDKERIPFDEAFKLSGGKLRSFRRPSQVMLLNHARKYAEPVQFGECKGQ